MKWVKWLFVIALSLSAAVAESQVETSGWGNWTLLRGTYAGDPDLCAELPNGYTAHVAVRGVDQAIWINTWNGRTQRWGYWQSLGGQFRSSPSITCSPYRMDVFATDTSGFIKWKTYYRITGRWSNWKLVPGIGSVSGPAAILRDSLSISLYVRGDDNAIYTAKSYYDQWGPWVRMGGVFEGDPSAGFFSGLDAQRRPWSMIRVVATRPGGYIMETYSYKYNDPNGPDVYSFWSDSNRRITSSPEITVDPTGRYDYFGRNPNNTLGHSWWGFSNWESLGGILAGKPGAAWVTTQQLVVVIRGNDNNLYYRAFNR